MVRPLGPQVLQHAKNLVWASVKDLLLVSKSCSTNATPVDPSIAIPPSLINALGNADLVREWIAPFLLRTDIITSDPDDVDEEQEGLGRSRAVVVIDSKARGMRVAYLSV